eukprot:TRINITY_DN64330_c0_g1_i1.p1 TRINITY_DN64330_c0_g1~~TRINITY_DN64330_c0_g1_i1.p1  ORF type:complete len:424 (+),score=66.80 TRINITY_DN64330_c0_g1_i1:113-1273(+)
MTSAPLTRKVTLFTSIITQGSAPVNVMGQNKFKSTAVTLRLFVLTFSIFFLIVSAVSWTHIDKVGVCTSINLIQAILYYLARTTLYVLLLLRLRLVLVSEAHDDPCSLSKRTLETVFGTLITFTLGIGISQVVLEDNFIREGILICDIRPTTASKGMLLVYFVLDTALNFSMLQVFALTLRRRVAEQNLFHFGISRPSHQRNESDRPQRESSFVRDGDARNKELLQVIQRSRVGAFICSIGLVFANISYIFYDVHPVAYVISNVSPGVDVTLLSLSVLFGYARFGQMFKCCQCCGGASAASNTGSAKRAIDNVNYDPVNTRQSVQIAPAGPMRISLSRSAHEITDIPNVTGQSPASGPVSASQTNASKFKELRSLRESKELSQTGM